MADVRHIVRRSSRGCWPDFVQRVRLGLIVAAVILILFGVSQWTMH